MRPVISNELLEALRAWELYLHSGSSPAPRDVELASFERNAGSSRCVDDEYDDPPVFDPVLGELLNASYLQLSKWERDAVNTHVLWSCWSPLCGLTTDWNEQREHEARRAKQDPERYDINLNAGLASMENACT